jgi:AcrR family transcriptional regulator
MASVHRPCDRAAVASPRKTRTPATARRARAGTAVQPRGQDRVTDILGAARAVMVEDGYAALTTRKVAERVGVRQSNVQYYFPAKIDLVRALFADSMARTERAVAERFASGRASPEARLLGGIEHFLETHHSLEEQRFLRELWALAAHDTGVAAAMNQFYRRWVDLTARNLLLINPALDRGRAQRRALLIVSVVDGLSLFRGVTELDHPSLRGIEHELRDLVRALAHGD